jgi:hypothetical protein
MSFLLHDPAKRLRFKALAVATDKDDSRFAVDQQGLPVARDDCSSPGHFLDETRCCIDRDEDSHVKIDGEREERRDRTAISSCGGCEHIEHETETHFVAVLGVDGSSSVIGEADISSSLMPRGL